MAIILSFLCFFAVLLGLTWVAFQLRFLFISNGKTTAIVLGVSVLTFAPAVIRDASQLAAPLQEQTVSASKPKSPADLAEEACKVAGVIPDCKEVLTRQIAEERAHPKLR